MVSTQRQSHHLRYTHSLLSAFVVYIYNAAGKTSALFRAGVLLLPIATAAAVSWATTAEVDTYYECSLIKIVPVVGYRVPVTCLFSLHLLPLPLLPPRNHLMDK